MYFRWALGQTSTEESTIITIIIIIVLTVENQINVYIAQNELKSGSQDTFLYLTQYL